jgi:hypothetical protein
MFVKCIVKGTLTRESLDNGGWGGLRPQVRIFSLCSVEYDEKPEMYDQSNFSRENVSLRGRIFLPIFLQAHWGRLQSSEPDFLHSSGRTFNTPQVVLFAHLRSYFLHSSGRNFNTPQVVLFAHLRSYFLHSSGRTFNNPRIVLFALLRSYFLHSSGRTFNTPQVVLLHSSGRTFCTPRRIYSISYTLQWYKNKYMYFVYT